MLYVSHHFIVPPDFFDVKPLVILIEITYCDKTEAASKQFIKMFNKFTNDKYDIRIKWLARKMKNIFKLKDPSIHVFVKLIKEFVFVEKQTSEKLVAM